ncbi:Opi1-domain-containing protein [Basidiobolus meristosporus CBS 931.73]|uniref:Opi1-domain-containing protein n=1 Tax=Basidiobolus meristosporus CBS 931.73 TaxID=1314790 RepID=A0A1Y1XJH3_9FUNG|nr:Opi1-domain-containing protein [Basidiobolus meristosporus CBS 931.73]|eukprot:ORX85576.1 Opi1-domain-containing protein [Basidiobolus meristosporus CBS 931.73]
MMGVPETGQSSNTHEFSKSKRNGIYGNKTEVASERSDFMNNRYNYLMEASTLNDDYENSHGVSSNTTSVNARHNGFHPDVAQSSLQENGLNGHFLPKSRHGSTPKEKAKPSPMSIMELCNSEDADAAASEEKDIAVQIAAQALDDLRTMGTNYSDSSNTHSIASPTTSEGDYASMTEISSANEHFISRVSNIPLVNTALRFYEQTKANSRVVKYGVETVESSVKSICQPVINKIEPHLGHLEEFACRQLDTLEKRYPSLMGQGLHSPKRKDDQDISPNGPSYSRQEVESSSEMRRRVRRREAEQEENSEDEDSSRKHRSPGDNEPVEVNHSALQPVATAVQPRSRWEQYLVEASTAAGAGAAVFSEESMKALKYCLQWLQFASHNIDTQIGLLREFLLRLSQPDSNSSAIAVASPTLASIKREVIETLRKVVDVVGRYAGACLPGEARNRVRNFILNLPGRWATINMYSASPSPASSPLLAPTSPNATPSQNMSESAHRILTLATESLLMLQSVAGIFKDSVERAESWVDRLRSMGMASSSSNGEDYRLLPPNEPNADPMVVEEDGHGDQMDVE